MAWTHRMNLYECQVGLLMDSWFAEIAAGSALPADATRELVETGFIILPGAVPDEQLRKVAQAYDSAVEGAAAGDFRIGSTTTRAHGLVESDGSFDDLYIYRPVLEACCRLLA